MTPVSPYPTLVEGKSSAPEVPSLKGYRGFQEVFFAKNNGHGSFEQKFHPLLWPEVLFSGDFIVFVYIVWDFFCP